MLIFKFFPLQWRIQRGAPTARSPLPRTKIFLISCSFWGGGGIWQICMLAPPSWRVGTPSCGESWIRPCIVQVILQITIGPYVVTAELTRERKWNANTMDFFTHAEGTSKRNIELPPANEVCEGNVFTGVCLSTGGHAWSGVCMAGGACMAGGVCVAGGRGACVAGETATAAGGTHPTGMHYCFN